MFADVWLYPSVSHMVFWMDVSNESQEPTLVISLNSCLLDIKNREFLNSSDIRKSEFRETGLQEAAARIVGAAKVLPSDGVASVGGIKQCKRV